MQTETETISKASRSDGAGVYAVSFTDDMTLRDADLETRKNSLSSIKIPDEGVEQESSPDDAKEESQITAVTFPEGGWRAWSVVFGVMSFTQDA